MTGSSPAGASSPAARSSPAGRRSNGQWPSPNRPSPNRTRLAEILQSDPRHTELDHRDALAAAKAAHDRVWEAAVKTMRNHELEEEQKRLERETARIRHEQRKEEERIRVEQQLRVEEERLRALKLKTVPKLPPEEPPAQPTSPATKPNASTIPEQPAAKATPNSQLQPASTTKSSLFGQPQNTAENTSSNQVNGINAAQRPLSLPQQQNNSVGKPLASSLATGQPPAGGIFSKPALPPQNESTTQTSVVRAPLPPDNDRYVEIHKNLKKLRASTEQAAKTSAPLKANMGDMRRAMRKNIGQLVGEKGGNKAQVAAIQELLHQALSGAIPSPLVDPSDYVTEKRAPIEGEQDVPQLPSLFLYLLNHFSKAIINQFINECGSSPKAADPIGVITAQIFSKKEFTWRGKPLIDILMAKFRVVCPVLFGYRGSETTEQGRTRLGWRRAGAGWLPEQAHMDRMKGLAVGYAAIALRDFSRSANTSPWPPSKYWTAMARIVNTPSGEISSTQCMVLRSMIEIYEDRFIAFYGTAAIAALRKALVEFPNRANVKTPAASGLEVLAQMYKRDIGLEL
ncbi:GLE1-like protein-domain-containing protein [Xylariomycetidae sp. FL2044]|nr:GLE1-like protein-domain-containing protein [Xylariomycetidae sp. FL2044]